VQARLPGTPRDWPLCDDQFSAPNVRRGSFAGTAGSDWLARDLSFAVASQTPDVRVHRDPATEAALRGRLLVNSPSTRPID
jgi:hypothetical protein